MLCIVISALVMVVGVLPDERLGREAMDEVKIEMSEVKDMLSSNEAAIETKMVEG